MSCVMLLIEAEIATAVRTTQQIGFGHNHSLCHGDLGNLEFLLLASEKLNDSALQDHTYRVAAGILQSIERNGWLCGVPNGVETPGLMTGITGIGYELLRLAAPARVPSLLIMEPPHGRFS
jgi:lantibiotic modifying enzyme